MPPCALRCLFERVRPSFLPWHNLTSISPVPGPAHVLFYHSSVGARLSFPGTGGALCLGLVLPSPCRPAATSLPLTGGSRSPHQDTEPCTNSGQAAFSALVNRKRGGFTNRARQPCAA